MGGLSPVDQRVAAMIREARETSGLSQARLAKLMAAYGFPWVQQTVGRAETRARSISIGEAVALAVILHMDISADKLGAELGDGLCAACAGEPPPGFTCNTCGRLA